MTELNKMSATVQTEGDLVYFSFYQEISGKDGYYMAFVYKTDEAFWMIQFVCEAGDAESKEPVFLEYAKSVTFE